MYAVVKTGGKQLKVAVGETVSVEKLDAAPGEVVTLSALLVNDDEKILVGEDAAAVAITAQVLGHGKADKVIVFKFKKRKGYKKTRGHRQSLTLLKVTDIAVGGRPAKKVEAKVETEAAAKPVAKKTAAPKKAVAKPAEPKKVPAKATAGEVPAEKAPVAAKKAPAKKPAAKPAAAKKPVAKKTSTAADKPAAAKKAPAKKPAAKKTEKPAE
jgi:large subunit ribosomal protein L21